MEISLTYVIIFFCVLILFAILFYLRSVLKQVSNVTNTVQQIGLKQENNKRKRSLHKALKTIVRTFKMLLKQKPEQFKDNSQLGSFNLIMKNQEGKYDLLKADGVIGDEIMQALEDLGIDAFIEKFT